ncbi:hypothetical protein ACHAXT_001509 [Thalassiosira profunda]
MYMHRNAETGEFEEIPLRNVNRFAGEDGVPPYEDHLLLQRQCPSLKRIWIGTGRGQFHPHYELLEEEVAGRPRRPPLMDNDWLRAGECLGAHQHIEELLIGDMDDISCTNQFAIFCVFGLHENKSVTTVEFTARSGLFRGCAFLCLKGFFEDSGNVTRLRVGRTGGDVFLDSEGTGRLSGALEAFDSLTDFEYRADGLCNEVALRLFKALEGHANLNALAISGSHRLERSGYAAFAAIVKRLDLGTLDLHEGFVDSELLGALSVDMGLKVVPNALAWASRDAGLLYQFIRATPALFDR